MYLPRSIVVLEFFSWLALTGLTLFMVIMAARIIRAAQVPSPVCVRARIASVYVQLVRLRAERLTFAESSKSSPVDGTLT